MSGVIWPDLDLGEAAAALERGETTASDIVQAHLDRIAALDGTLHAGVTVLADEARASTAASDRRWQEGRPLSPIDGLPLALKDNFDLAGVRTTNGTRVMARHIAREDAVTVARLRAAGATFVAKVNLDELALGGSCDNPVTGATLNPWDAASVPGGSSGGSGAAVAAGMCMAGTGSDTGGSIRNPSAWCGVSGLKTTNGAIDTKGVIPLSVSLDSVGFLARTVSDLALLFAHTVDFLATDMTGRAEFVRRALQPASRPMLGVVSSAIVVCEGPVREVCIAAVDALGESSDLLQVELPPLEDALATLLTIMLTDAASSWGPDLDRTPEAFGPGVRSLLRVGRALDADSRARAEIMRHRLTSQVDTLFERYDAILMPSMGLAPRADAYAGVPDGPEHPMWPLAAQLTCVWNLAGNPVVSLPCGFTEHCRPVAMQVVGARGREGALLRVATHIERTLAIPRESLVPTWVAGQLAGDSTPISRPQTRSGSQGGPTVQGANEA